MKRILIIFIILTFSFKVFGDESLVPIKQKLEKIERDISDLQVVVFSKKDKELIRNYLEKNDGNKYNSKLKHQYLGTGRSFCKCN